MFYGMCVKIITDIVDILFQFYKVPVLNLVYVVDQNVNFTAVFGKVTDGMDIVDAIADVEKGDNDLPIVPVTYTVEVVE